MKVICAVNSLPHCCGVYEAGSFRVRGYAYHDGPYADTWEGLLDAILNYPDGKEPILFNFVKPKFPDEYETEIYGEFDEDGYCAGELRQLVMKHPNAHHIGTFYNTNSSNTVDSWYIFNKD